MPRQTAAARLIFIISRAALVVHWLAIRIEYPVGFRFNRIARGYDERQGASHRFALRCGNPRLTRRAPRGSFNRQAAEAFWFRSFILSPLSCPTVNPNRSLPSTWLLLRKKRFEEFLQARNQRQTWQRRFLIAEVFREHDHFDADELMERLPRKGQDNYVSPATVYRTLNEFVDAGLLKCFQLDGRTVYDFDYGYPQHDHLYCTRCRKLIEFQSDELIKLRDAVASEEGFRVSGHRFIVQGICRECAKSRRKKRKQDLV